MKTLARYLLRTVVVSTALVMLVLIALAGFFEFIGQLGSVGDGNYAVPQAAVYTILRLPMLSVEMLPIAVLIGAMLGLGGLAGNSELIAMRSAGVSKVRLSIAVAMSGVLIMVFSIVVGEYLAPPMDQFARKYRSSARNLDAGLTGDRSTWVRDGTTVFNLERISSELGFGGVYLFNVDGQQLTAVGHADTAGIDSSDRWVLDNYSESSFSDVGVTSEQKLRSVQYYNVSAAVLGVAVVKPGSLSVRGLRTYIDYLRGNELDAAPYESEFWHRIAATMTIVLMPILAIGFVFGSLRNSGAGGRLMVGVMIGLAWFLATTMLSNSGQVFDLNPALLAWLPTAVLGLVTILVVSRVT